MPENKEACEKRITARKQGFFIVKKVTDQYLPSFKGQHQFRKNAKNASWVMKNLDSNVQQIKYIVGENNILIDCDDPQSVKLVENILLKLDIEPYSYQTSPGHKHFWFKTDDNVNEMIKTFKLNSLNHQLYIDGIDTRAFRVSRESTETDDGETKSGGVFIYDSKKDNSTRPSAIELINNLYSETLPVCPIMLIIPAAKKWNKLGAHPIDYKKVVKSGEGKDVTRHDQELTFTKNFQQAGLKPEVAHQWWKEIVKFNNDFKRPAPELQYIKSIYRQKNIKANVVVISKEYKIDKDEKGVPYDIDAAKKMVTERAKELQQIIMNELKWVYYSNEYYVQDKTNNARINFTDYHDGNSAVKEYFKIESAEVIQYEKNLIAIVGFTPLGVPIEWNAKKIAIKNTFTDLKRLKNRIVDIQHSVVCNSHYIVDNTVFQNIGGNEPFTTNKIDRDYKPDVKCPPLLDKYLMNLCGTRERLKKFLDLRSFSIANTPSPSALVITGPPKCGKGTMSIIENGVIGINNVGSLDGAKVCNGEAFSLQGIVGKLTGLFEEQGGLVVSKVNNLFKKLFDGVEVLSGISEKYKKLRINKNTTSFTLFSNDVLEFDITDPALMERFSFINMYPYYKESEKLNADEYAELMSNPDTYDWLFKTYFERQVKLLGKFKQRNIDYKFDNEAYIKAIFELTPLLQELSNGHYLGKSTFIAKNVSKILETKTDIPVQAVKRALHYTGYTYDPLTDSWTYNEWAENAK